MPQGKFGKKFELKIFVFEFWKKQLGIPLEGNGKKWKKMILIFVLKFEKKNGHITRGKWKEWICHENLKWKNLKIFIFEI
jgi:hypothetical protein